MKNLNVHLPDELHKRLKIACTLEGRDMTSVVLKMVEEYVERVEKRKLIMFSKKK